MPVARLGAGQRAIILGKTESGKTHLVRTAIAQTSSWVVVDSKCANRPHEPSGWGAELGGVVTRDPGEILRHPKVVFQVSERSLRDRAGWNRPGSWGFLWTAALRAIKRRGRTVVDFNEALQTLPANGCHPEALEVFTQGAAFDLMAWLETQAANWLSTVILRQAELLISFHCQAQQDRDIIARARGVDAGVLAQLDEYWWAAHYIRDRELTVFPPLPVPRARRVPPADAAAPPELDEVGDGADNAHEQAAEEEPRLAT